MIIPRVLTPCVLTLRVLTPRVLTPRMLTPRVLIPGILIPLMLIPRVLILRMLCPLPFVCCENKLSNTALHRNSSYDLARLHLVAPMDFWRNSTPFFGAAAFCTTKNGDFRK